MTKAPIPMMGGMIIPPTPAAASTAPANCGRYPTRFISGMENDPVVYTLETEEPLSVP